MRKRETFTYILLRLKSETQMTIKGRLIQFHTYQLISYIFNTKRDYAPRSFIIENVPVLAFCKKKKKKKRGEGLRNVPVANEHGPRSTKKEKNSESIFL